jgi:uncharacterized protein DUF6159
MSEMSLPATTFAERDFRVGEAMNKAITMLSRNLLPFSIVTGIAALPQVLLFDRHSQFQKPSDAALVVAGLVLTMVLSALSQAVVLYGSFESMRGGQPDVLTSFRHAWRRFVPVIGVAILTAILAALAGILLIFPAFMLITAWYVATPVCVVERIGPWQAMKRSAVLTKGHRWKLFGVVIVVAILGAIGSGMVAVTTMGAGVTIGIVAKLIWSALFGAYAAILVVVIYHDLRVAKEGVNTDQIAAVFE